jgi:adenylate kinase
MVRVYIHNVPGYVGSAMSKVFTEREHEIVGSYFEGHVSETSTLNNGNAALTEMASVTDLEKVNSLIMSSDTIIFSAAEAGALDHARAALRLLKRGGYEGTKQFILVSSVMTWARTKISGETAETGLKEENYTKRKPAASSSELKTLESQTMALARENLQTFVVSPGLLYGAGENILHALFRQGWLCEGSLPIVHSTRGGSNILPMIHVADMARVVASIIESPPDTKYIVAVDKARSTLREVVTKISTGIGNGKTIDLTREETQELMLSDPDIGALNMHVYFDAETTTSSTIGIEWVCEEGFIVNAENVINEFKKARDLRPVRLVLNGPPCCNTTDVLATKLAGKLYTFAFNRWVLVLFLTILLLFFFFFFFRIENYYLPLVTPTTAVTNALYIAPKPIVEGKDETKEEGDEEEPVEVEPTEDEIAANELREEINAAGVSLDENGNVGDISSIPDTLMCRIMKKELSSCTCKNQGWVLQNYPSTWREATGLWAEGVLEEGDADDTGDADGPLPEPEETGAYKPTGVVLLNGEDEWLTECAMEKEMKEEEFTARLNKYRERNADDNERSVASFFESVLRVDTILHNVNSESSNESNMTTLINETCMSVESGGSKPFNYHPTPEEEAESLRKALEESKRSAEETSKAEALQKEQEEKERNARNEEQRRRLNEIKAQEDELLEARSAPLRAYLMKHVIPTLTEGLIETCKVMPDDPVDYLAEFMFRASPAVEEKTDSGKRGKK